MHSKSEKHSFSPDTMVINAPELAGDILSFWNVHVLNNTFWNVHVLNNTPPHNTSVPDVPRNCFGCHQMWVQKMTERTATVAKHAFAGFCMTLPD
eukprot:45553-Chlamydomonas_euryale.AAC.1